MTQPFREILNLNTINFATDYFNYWYEDYDYYLLQLRIGNEIHRISGGLDLEEGDVSKLKRVNYNLFNPFARSGVELYVG